MPANLPHPRLTVAGSEPVVPVEKQTNVGFLQKAQDLQISITMFLEGHSNWRLAGLPATLLLDFAGSEPFVPDRTYARSQA